MHKMLPCFVLILCVVSCTSGLTFLSPPPLAAAGKIYSNMFSQLYPYVDTKIFGTNVSVVIATDVAGCQASITPAAGKVVWYTVSACENLGLGDPRADKWAAFQQVGAIGIIETMFGSATEFDAGNIFRGAAAWRPSIPAIVIRNLRDWHSDQLDPTNPWIGLAIFGFIGNPNITAIYDFPDVNQGVYAVSHPPSVMGFIYYTAIALTLISLCFGCSKLALFVTLFQPIRIGIPHIILTLCIASSFFLLFFLLWGPWIWVHNFEYSVVAFFQFHFLPYWYAAIAVYSFYLAEVSLLTSTPVGLFEKFKWPVLIVCVLLWIIEIVQASLFAAYSPSTNIIQVLKLLACLYLVVSSLLIILLAVATVLLVRSFLKSGQNANVIRFVVSSAFLAIFLIFSNLVFYFIANTTLSHGPQWGNYGPVAAGMAGLWWGTPFACIQLELMLSLRVEKEIEVSKTANSTGGTSSSSSHGSSKGSSSSSSDNSAVIEL